MNDLYQPDATTLANDDELLDTLGRGERPAHGDPLTVAFAMWRNELAAPSPMVVHDPIRHIRHKVRWGVISAAVAAIISGGVTVAAAATAEPGSPLWPITERVWVDRASATSAEVAQTRIEAAREAVTEQRPEEAQRLLSEAEKLLDNVQSTTDQQLLATELTQVRELLKSLLGIIVPTPGPGQPAPAQTPSPAPSGPTPTPTPSPSQPGGLLPLPLPTIKLPLLG